jgi:SAM-dependent methyltransferase
VASVAIFSPKGPWRSNASSDDQWANIVAFEAGLLGAETFTLPGHCTVCDRAAAFLVDHQYCSITSNGQRLLNWRERLICPRCRLNNRTRAAVTFLLSVSGLGDSIYLTERVSPLFRAIASMRPRTIGGEFLRDGTARGAKKGRVRHEDATRLTFSDSSIDVIGTFDVLEHVPNYRQALSEFYRCLRPGGRLILTVPFDLNSAATIIRATIDASGTVTHLLPPDIHGDPLDSEGALCFYHFGWDLLDVLREIGFADANVSLFWDARLGHLGGYQGIISAQKAGQTVPDQGPRFPPSWLYIPCSFLRVLRRL